MNNLKKIDVCQLVVGRRYFVDCGSLCGSFIFVRSEKMNSKTYYRFTRSDKFDNWLNDFGFTATMSDLKIYEGVE